MDKISDWVRNKHDLEIEEVAEFHKGFEPLLPGVHYADFGDLEGVITAFDRAEGRIGTVIVEPLQGEGGISLLLGSDGAGKTTTLKCLAGLIPATAGALQVAGCDHLGDSIELKHQLAYVPDDPPLFDDLSVGQHLDFIGRLYRVDDRRSKAIELLKQFDLIDKYDAGATTLSRGMRQKLAVCCAYLHDPAVLLLDEPLTGLDPPGIRVLLESVRSRAARGTTTIISSHLLAMIEDTCTHLLVMQDGRSEYFGETEHLRRRFPKAASLEDAYFAATSDQDSLPLNESPLILPIGDFRAGAVT